MEFIPIKTRALLPPQDNLFEIMDEYLKDLKDGDILFITSKVVAIHQGLCIKNDSKISKKELVEQEADSFLKTDIIPGKDIYLTIKNNILIPSAGIDESNANGYFILWPKNLLEFSKEVYERYSKKFKLKKFGIIITDSTARPGKWGVGGIGIYSYGIVPLFDERGQKDIFGRELAVTQVNVVDAITPMAVYLMGEGSETQPLIIGRNIPGIKYSLDETLYDKTTIPPEKDLYRELLKPLIK